MLFSVIYRIYPGQEVALLQALLLGEDSVLTHSITQAFRFTGIAHMIAICGFYITIVS